MPQFTTARPEISGDEELPSTARVALHRRRILLNDRPRLLLAGEVHNFRLDGRARTRRSGSP
ncbi:hypothetical protein [Micromonospora sp. NPDC047738]|uniref:hypothetical protein n=1 Tax=unclassified Micromonospora TaxID=2617518 RepID=UPI0033D15A1B